MFDPSPGVGFAIMLFILAISHFAYSYKKSGSHPTTGMWINALSDAYQLPKRLMQSFDDLLPEKRRFAIAVVVLAYIPLCGFPVQFFGVPQVNAVLGGIWSLTIFWVFVPVTNYFPLRETDSVLEQNLANSIQSTIAMSIAIGFVIFFCFDVNQVFSYVNGERVGKNDYPKGSLIEVIVGAGSLAPLLVFVFFLVFRHITMERLFIKDLAMFEQLLVSLGYFLVTDESVLGKSKTLRKELEIESWKKLFSDPQIIRSGKPYLLYSIYLNFTKDKYGVRYLIEEPQSPDPLWGHGGVVLDPLDKNLIQDMESKMVEFREGTHPLDLIRELHAPEEDVKDRFIYFKQEDLYTLLVSSQNKGDQ